MDDSDLLLISSVYLGAILVNRRRERIRRRRRRLWVRPINMRRRQQGAFHNLFQELKTDPQMFWKYARMTLPSFQNLLDIANPSLLKRSPRAINPEQRLALTLRFLSGDKVPAIAFAYRVGLSTVHKIIKETSDALGRVLGHRYLQAPSKEEYLQIAEGFWQLWNFPHCLGAIDGKHVDAQCPPNSGTLYFNYHKRYSVVLMAVCDHNYKFTLVDIGSAGKNSDGGIFAISDLNPENRQLNIPEGASILSGRASCREISGAVKPLALG
ncbi:protein ANTAGONIST OF LIKE HETEROCHROMATIN PROTEIN 1-like isoform X2 [Neodiprion fabricii]|uniref:protein ANTAGONIST OF LIKE HETEROCHROMATIN PROTEIN 1-like isoform X2 n=1 Tax=Neodiprion fabricii TaxID=2872261 RepID=UPI001ED8C169|nr:protein ANTAGONIST OF LIKE HETEROCHROMATIN PROTEIN 1-like isoform X2 [Neodiprion fabricii]